jgi:hypothetical protein
MRRLLLKSGVWKCNAGGLDSQWKLRVLRIHLTFFEPLWLKLGCQWGQQCFCLTMHVTGMRPVSSSSNKQNLGSVYCDIYLYIYVCYT